MREEKTNLIYVRLLSLVIIVRFVFKPNSIQTKPINNSISIARI